MRVPHRLSHGVAALVLVVVTVVVVAQATLGSNGFSVGRLLAGHIHVPAQECRGSIASPHRRALVLYDNTGRYAAYGAQAGVFAANFVSHFARPVRQPVRTYRPGEMAHYAAVVYVGTDYGEPLPSGFLADVRANVRPVLWLGENAWQLTDAAFARTHGWLEVADHARDYRFVRYRHVRLTITSHDLDGIDVVDPAKATVIGTAIAAHGISTPWAVRSGKLTYVSEVPLDSEGGHDRSFAVADMMARLFGRVPHRHRALIRLEDVGPTADPVQLRHVADLLAAEHVPFSVAVYPVYVGPLDQHPRQRIRLQDSPQVVDAIKYMLSKGGTLVLHGYTHQLGDRRNPSNGESAEDYEFYRVHFNAHHTLVYDGPVTHNSGAWTRHRIGLALAEIHAAGLPRPMLWEFPHYGAAPADYRVAASMFVARFERGNYAAGPAGHEDLSTLTEQTPPYLVRDIYGGPVLPETLGHVMGPHIPATGQGSIRRILAAAAVQKAAVRDNVAGVFYHPFLGTKPLRQLIDGLRHEGYQFASACSVLKE
ncbi:MAG: DUF2334 domain-containing protein [Micromonosporaceae bacterium]